MSLGESPGSIGGVHNSLRVFSLMMLSPMSGSGSLLSSGGCLRLHRLL